MPPEGYDSDPKLHGTADQVCEGPEKIEDSYDSANDHDYSPDEEGESDDSDSDSGGDEEEEEEEEEEGDDYKTDGYSVFKRDDERKKQEAEALQRAREKESALTKIEEEIRNAASKAKQLNKDEFLSAYGDSLDYIMPDLSRLLTDKSQATPSLALARAIRWGNEPFIRTILSLELQTKDPSLKDSLKDNLRERFDTETTSGNSIHWSIEKLKPDLTVQLIEKAAGDECLLAIDRKGYTPLHLAVQYPNCLNRVEVIKALLRYGDKALDLRCSEGLSVYKYYQKTKAAFQGRKQPAALSLKSRKSLGDSRENSKRPLQKPGRLKIEREDQREKSSPPRLEDSKGEDRDNRQVAKPEEVALRNLGEGGEPVQPLQRKGTALKEASKELKTHQASKVPTKPKKGGTKKNANGKKVATLAKSSKDEKKEKEIEDEIEDEIKLQYLRSTFKQPKSDVKSINGFLYAEGNERPFSLTMLQGPPLVDEYVFTTVYNKEKFDQTLHHVAVRRIIFKQIKNQEVAGRTDMEILFKLLRDKGVRHIVKVIVFDLEAPPHSDESIERCLSGFKSIEILDWRKVDLCPETIFKACHNVVELHLWWSGNNGILMAWSAPGGLAKFPRLKEIYIHQTQSGQALPVTVLEMWPDISINDSDTSYAAQPSRSLATYRPQLNQTASRYRRHQWLEIMDKFAAGINLIDLAPVNPPDISPGDALELAIDPKRKFDIISMSWTIAKNDQNSVDLDRLQVALKKACDTNQVLLFCASPDGGEMAKAQAENFYPYGCNDAGLFKIAAATVDGIRIPMAGSHHNYSLPGHEVEDTNQSAAHGVSDGQQIADNENSGLKTGSSIATALGAGLAALIIHCVRLGAAYMHSASHSSAAVTSNELTTGSKETEATSSRLLGSEALDQIKRPAHMRRVFNHMISDNNSTDRFIEVWEFFAGCGDELKKQGRQIKTLKLNIEDAREMGAPDVDEMIKELQKKNDERMMEIVKLAFRFISI
ncbi:hypothetical protein J3F84DRAFT_401937 [Trichoderma pleuroticola]